MRRMRIFITTRVTHCKKSLYMAIILLLSCITLSSFDNNYNSHYQVLFVDSFWSNVFTWQQDNNVGWALEGKQQHRWAPRNTLLHALHSKSRDTIHYFKPWNPSYKTAWAQTLPLFAERGGETICTDEIWTVGFKFRKPESRPYNPSSIALHIVLNPRARRIHLQKQWLLP